MAEGLRFAEHIGQVFSNRRFDMDSSVIPTHLFDEWEIPEESMLPKKSCGMFIVANPNDYANHAIGNYDINNLPEESLELLNTEPDNTEGWGEEVTNQELLRMNLKKSTSSSVQNRQNTPYAELNHNRQSSQEIESTSPDRLKYHNKYETTIDNRHKKSTEARNSKTNSGKRNKNSRRSLKHFGLPED